MNTVDELTSKGAWIEDLRFNATTGIKPCKWVMKVKKNCLGEVTCHKWRIVLRGVLEFQSRKRRLRQGEDSLVIKEEPKQ